MLTLVAGCLALRTRNGRLKNSFNPGGTLPTHPVGPKKWTCIDMRGLLKWPNTGLSYLVGVSRAPLEKSILPNFIATAWGAADKSLLSLSLSLSLNFSNPKHTHTHNCNFSIMISI